MIFIDLGKKNEKLDIKGKFFHSSSHLLHQIQIANPTEKEKNLKNSPQYYILGYQFKL